ncbi:MAG TPA: response regulator transcription factor [Acidobacteriota bacterium]|nr:response regulator transcription factor [Acidobacteriota bacterium]
MVDDHPMTRHGISQRLRYEPDFRVCAAAGTATAAISAVERHAPDLVLVDLSLTERSGLELIKDLHALRPELSVLVFSMHYESLYAERALRAGARGYIMKSEGAEMLVEAIRRVLRGEIYLSPMMRNRSVHRFARPPVTQTSDNTRTLSDREQEIYELIGRGLDTPQICERLNLSSSTVETHRTHIKQKLNLHSATDLVRSAAEWVNSRGLHSP